MQSKLIKRSGRSAWVGVFVLAIALGLQVPAALAEGAGAAGSGGAKAVLEDNTKAASDENANPVADDAAKAQKPGGPANSIRPGAKRKAPQKVAAYFIDFRARFALSYGHTFSVYGKLDSRGRIIESTVAGLHPIGDGPEAWTVGHVIWVPSETGASDGDTEDEYISASYRILLSEPEYTRLVAYIKQLQAHSPMWHAVLYNCNAFVAEIAKFMGLKTPYSPLLYPADFINNLREINGGQQYWNEPTAVSLTH